MPLRQRCNCVIGCTADWGAWRLTRRFVTVVFPPLDRNVIVARCRRPAIEITTHASCICSCLYLCSDASFPATVRATQHSCLVDERTFCLLLEYFCGAHDFMALLYGDIRRRPLLQCNQLRLMALLFKIGSITKDRTLVRHPPPPTPNFSSNRITRQDNRVFTFAMIYSA